MSFVNVVVQPSAAAAIVFLGAVSLSAAALWMAPAKVDPNEERIRELEDKMNAVMLQRGMLG